MWGAPEEPPDQMEKPGPSEEAPISVKDICEDNRSQLETFKDIMLKNKSDLKKKEEELQEYASKLSEIKSRAKRSRRSKDGASSTEGTPKSRAEGSLPEVEEDTVDDISQARTPKARSSLLQRKLAENRKIFEQRNKEMTENKRAVEEKVEAIRQQMDQTDLTIIEAQKEPMAVTPVRPVLVTPQLVSPILHIGQDKDNKIAELSNKILELEATVIDLQENLREKDSVIDSKTRAVTLMSADLSKKGKTTLDTLEETKDEMRTMQENFVLIETSLKGKNENLLEQLQERNVRVTELEDTINRYEQEMEENRVAETASANFSRSTMDTLVDTKEAMRSMQENFVLIETSLKDKIENLLGQLEDRETKLAEAVDKMYKLETGAGIVTPPEIPDLQYKIDRLEQSNRALQDEKYELQKSIAELQEKIVARESTNGNGLIIEKDNRIAELENLIEELKNSNQLLEEESKAELQKQVVELAKKNEEFNSKIDELERINNDLETERNELRAKMPDDSGPSREDTMVQKLTKELDDLNKSMIKLKAQHKGKLRNLQKQLESFKMVSDANAELVKLGNQVALLEEEKGNLQLSLVDFDELKASAGDWQDRIADLESRVTTQTKDIQSNIEAIAILENQKLDLMQELHTAKQEISALEAENAESENLRVTAEMKVVDLEEQLESSNKTRNVTEGSQLLTETEREDLLRKIENLTHENGELVQKVAKLEEKPSSDAGSTESFETIHEDRNEMLKKMEALTSRNSELEEKLLKLEENARSNVGSTESFETINDNDKSELVKKIDVLSRENSDLVAKLIKYEEKGSSDTGSTESFEKIPEQGDHQSRIEFLTRENNDLVIKLTKLEEKLDYLDSQPTPSTELLQSEGSLELEQKLQSLVQENSDLVIELTKVQEKMSHITEDKNSLEKQLLDAQNAMVDGLSGQEDLKSRLEVLTSENNDLIIKLVKLEEKNSALSEDSQKLVDAEADCQQIRVRENTAQSDAAVTVASLENEIEECRKLIADQTDAIDDMKFKLAEKEAELEKKISQISEYEATGQSVEELQRELKESFGVVEEWKLKCSEMEQKMEMLEAGKLSIKEGLKLLWEENKSLTEQSKQKDIAVNSLKEELDSTITTFETRLEAERSLIVKQEEEIDSLRRAIESKDQELHDKYSMLQNEMIKIDSLQDELNTCRIQLQQNEIIIVSLNEEIQRLNDHANVSRAETESTRAEILVLREELSSKADKEARNEELSRLLSDKESLADEMKTILNEQLKENADLRNTMESTNTEVARLRESFAARENEVASITEAKLLAEENLREATIARDDMQDELASVRSQFDENMKYTDELKTELSDAYRMLELLKAKHTEDIDMQNRRLEDLFEDLNGRTSELEIMKSELTEKTDTIRQLEEKTSELGILKEELSEKANLIRELEVKTSEFEILRAELSEKEKLVGQNVTEQVKIALEVRVTELEGQLEEAAANAQAQLQKRKILAANLKKKSAEATELEARVAQLQLQLGELEPKLSELETRLSYVEPRSADLEARAVDLEEKWITEKSEKEAANLRIQEIETVIQNRDDAIMQLESQLRQSRSETAAAASRVDELSNELQNSSDKLKILMEQTNEMGEEIERLRTDLDLRSSELESAKLEKESLVSEHETSRLALAEEESQRQQVLDEAKEKARELGVRMQVMEAEYVDQLNTIQTLRTENGMLVSKQAQINERLENTEKESADRQILLDQLQREADIREARSLEQRDTSGTDEERSDVEGKSSVSQPCDQCDQCQTVVQALEAKLQERDAEIENLDNELANSIGNFVHMRESLRVSDLMNQSGSRNRSTEESRDNSDLVFQYNTLTTSNAEMRDQLNATVRENQDLKEKIASLQSLNAALQERTGAVEEELIEGREATTRLHAVDALHAELAERCELRENELSGVRDELEVMKQRHEEWIAAMNSQVEELTMVNSELTKKYEDQLESQNTADTAIGSLRTEVDTCQRRIQELETEIDRYKQENIRLLEENSIQVETSATSSGFFHEKVDDSPQLFDAAKVFGSPTAAPDSEVKKELDELRGIVTKKDQEILQLSEQIASLQAYAQQMSSRSSEDLHNAQENCQRLETELSRVEQILNERNRQIDSLNNELNNVGVQLSAQFDQRGNNEMLQSSISMLKLQNEELDVKLNDREATIEHLTAEKSQLAESLQQQHRENFHLSGMIDLLSSVTSQPEALDEEKIAEMTLEIGQSELGAKLVEMLNHLTALRQERSELLAAQDSFRQRIAGLEREVENSSDATRVQELEERVDRMVRERDIKQLQVNDLTRSLEELQESMETASSNEEIRLRNLQAALDQALGEHDRLKVQLEALKKEKTEGIVETAEIQHPQDPQTSEIGAPATNVDSGWDDETKLEVDEEMWSWNADEAESHGHLAAPPLLPNVEIALKARIAELEDTIKDLEAERDKLADEAKTGQIRSGKLVKKLKEFKIQNESLQQQLKIQKASGGFCDLDSAIEEELKSQITRLEKALNEAKEENKKAIAEREIFAKRIEVLSSANERLVEMKERQDMEVEVLQIRTRDLSTKLEALEWKFKEACGDEDEVRTVPVAEVPIETRHVEAVQGSAVTSTAPASECFCKKYREELDVLRDEMEALAAENEQLQKLLEEHKNTRLSTESTLSAELSKRGEQVEELSLRNAELEKNLGDATSNYQTLMDEFDRMRKEYEDSVKSNAEQTASIKQECDALKLQITENTSTFEAGVESMRQEINSSAMQIDALQEHLQALVREKEELMERAKSHEETREKLSSLTDAMTDVTGLLNARVQEVAELKQEMQKLKVDKNEALSTVEGLAQNHTRELTEKQLEAEQYVRQCESQLTEKSAEIQVLTDKLLLSETKDETKEIQAQQLRDEIATYKSHREFLQSELASKEQELFRDEDQVRNYAIEIERLNGVISHMQKSSADAIDEAGRKIREIEEREASLKRTIAELTSRESDALAQMYREISEKDSQVMVLQQTISKLEEKVYEVAGSRTKEKTVEATESIADSSPVTRSTADDSQELRNTLDQLRAELSRKEDEIEDYKYQLSESTYPSIIRALQDQVNVLYDEKAQLEQSLTTVTDSLYNEQRQKEVLELAENMRKQKLFQSDQEYEDDELARLNEKFEAQSLDIINLEVQFRARQSRLEIETKELKVTITAKDEEIETLRRQLESTREECELHRRAAITNVSDNEAEILKKSESLAASAAADDAAREQTSNEMDLALYMLHQRDVRCEELTHELMQLLEERDTLQLRLSNAIRVNEELRRSLPADAHTSETLQGIVDVEPLVEQPSPSRSVGPVEIAKEAIDSPSDEKVVLAEKLSQLHNTGHRRDVRLMDDRDMRHNQQMSLLAHRDVLSTLPPEAAARIVNANYTLSRDVQSQSSVLMNWLWGKSTPKVVHM